MSIDKVKLLPGFVLLALACLLLVAMALFPDLASAAPSADGVTPTVTSPAGWVPTVLPTLDYSNLDCPTGTPVGWGTVTPDPGWLVMCEQCIPQTALPTSTPRPSTPDPSVTGTPATATPTATLEVTPTPSGHLTGLSCGWVEGSGSTCEASEDGARLYIYVPYQDVYGTTNEMHFIIGPELVGHQIYITYFFETTYGNSCGFGLNYPWWRTELGRTTAGLDTWVSDHANAGDYYFWTQDEVSTVYSPGGAFLKTWMISGWPCSYMSDMGAHAIITTYPTAVTPTPTPAVSSGYCGSVQSTQDLFGWDGIDFGASACFDIGPYSGISILGWDFAATPHLAHLCAQDVSLGTVTIFGVSLSLQVIAYVLGIAWVVRNMFVS